MGKAHLVPTPLDEAADRSPMVIALGGGRRRRSSLVLFFRLLGFGIALAWSSRVRKRPALERAKRVRHFLEMLGGMWIKAGQLFSLRADLLSPEMVEQLSLLQYQSYGFPSAVARTMIEEALGRPIEQVFSSFEEQPFAAASISQIHRARLRHDGTEVAVKVQRPEIEGLLSRDLGLIRWLLRRMKSIPTVSYLDWEGMIRELERMLHEEVDYAHEIANLRRMRKVLRDHKVHVPKVFRKLSSRRVIVMEYVRGVVMSDYIRVGRSDPARVEAWRRENDVDPHKVGSRLMCSFYRQVLEDNIFHGDLHPGNIMLLRDSRFALIDFGTVGSLESRFVRLYKQQAMAFVERDWSKAVDTYLLMADSIPPFDIDAYRTEFVEVARAWEARSHLHGLSYLERSLTGGLATRLGQVNQRHQVNLSWQFLRVGRSISTMDANLGNLLGDEDPNKILYRYFRAAGRRARRRLLSAGLHGAARMLADVNDTVGYVSESLRRAAIPMGAWRSKASQILELVARGSRVVVVIGLVVLVYDFLHAYHFDLVGALHARLGAFKLIAERLPTPPYEVGVVVLLTVAALVFVLRRVITIFAREPIRGPDRRTER